MEGCNDLWIIVGVDQLDWSTVARASWKGVMHKILSEQLLSLLHITSGQSAW